MLYNCALRVLLKGSMEEYRFYSFVAGLYLSPLQCGLQTAHAVAAMSTYPDIREEDGISLYQRWAQFDQTIIICNAMNSRGVENTFKALSPFAELFKLPMSQFYEDEESLNNAATAVGIIVPRRFYMAEFQPHTIPQGETFGYFEAAPNGEGGMIITYESTDPEFEFCKLLKSYRLV
jgi:hypothetical protein